MRTLASQLQDERLASEPDAPVIFPKSKITSKPIQNSPEPSGLPTKHAHKSYNIMRTCSRNQSVKIIPETTKQTPKRMKFSMKLKNFKYFKRISELCQINSVLNKICRHVMNTVINLYQVSESKFGPGSNKVKFRSNLLIL